MYILKNYPPKDYPKLYPKPFDFYAEKAAKSGLGAYKNINLLIAAIGLGILIWATTSGHSFNPLGGDEIFVLMYFVLQVIPLFYLEIKGYKQYKRMRQANIGGARKAELNPRNLFDFISPAFVALAALLYVGFILFYLYDKGFSAPWEWEVYVTLASVTGMNLMFAGMIAKHMVGKKFNPHQAHDDRLRQIRTVVKIGVFASIAASVFLIMTDLADKFAWELYDPILMSIYVQLILSLSLGLEFRKIKIEKIDFEVYKKDKPVTTA
ncbi:MAG: hypothetical protein IIB64_09335 [Proteobacteria bacterium]|nr:hypothetical protein [Pseudomonadota bacterium]